MGKNATGDKPKFDFITASKTKKYKIIFGVILVLGILLLIGGFLLRSTLTKAVTPNSLNLDFLSNLNSNKTECIISQDQCFRITTGTPTDRALANPIIFDLDENAQQFVEVRDKSNTTTFADNQTYYPGLFWLHIQTDVDIPEYIGDGHTDQDRPSGYLTIKCGSKALKIKLIYYKDAKAVIWQNLHISIFGS